MEYIPGKLNELKPRELSYAIGIEYNQGEFGMIAGPTKNETEMLETFGSDKYCIIRFNPDWTDDVVWRWNNDRWISSDT